MDFLSKHCILELLQKNISKGEAKRQKKENFAITQLLLVAGSFLLGYLPFCGT